MTDIILAWQMIRRRPARSLLFLVQLTVCFTMCAVAAGYVFQAWAVARLPYQVLGQDTLGLYFTVSQDSQRQFTPVSPDDVAELATLPAVRSAAVIHRLEGTADGHPVTVVAVNDAYIELTGLPVHLPPGRSAASVTRRLARRLGAAPGDHITVGLSGGHSFDLVVVESAPAVPLPPRFPFPKTVGEFTVTDDVLFVLIDDVPGITDVSSGLWILAEPGQTERAGAAVSGWWRARHPQSAVALEWFAVADACAELIESSYVVLRSLAPLGVLLLLLAGAGFVGTTMLSVDSRRAEIAVRRALGATVRQIARQLACECLTVVVPAAAASTLIGAVVTLAASPGARAPAAVVLATGGLSLVLGLLCAAAGTAYPLSRAGRDDPAVTLKQEG